ncbi:hypothetical protein H0H92_003697 [Tricholoma furcatifolium]|nr:hypothetical protein H0H92_003697 [Tricholoma furcatifolium]
MKKKLNIFKRLRRIASNALAARTSNVKEKIAKLNIFKCQRSAANAAMKKQGKQTELHQDRSTKRIDNNSLLSSFNHSTGSLGLASSPPLVNPYRTIYRVLRNEGHANTISITATTCADGNFKQVDISEQMAQALKDNGIPPTTVVVTWDIASGLQPEDSELKEVLRKLASNVSLLGTADYFPFGSWESLMVSLPFQALPYDPDGILTLPVESLTNLRELVWHCHPTNMYNSWFPLDSALLQKLEILYIRTHIPAEDCINIMCKAPNVKELWIDSVIGPSPTTVTPNEFCLPLLEELWIAAYTDVTSVLKAFQFPVLRDTTLWLHDKNTRSGIPDLANLNWDSPGIIAVGGSLSDEDRARIISQCGPPNRKMFLPLAIEWLHKLREPDMDDYHTRKRIMWMPRSISFFIEERKRKKDGDDNANGNINNDDAKKDEGDVNGTVGNDDVKEDEKEDGGGVNDNVGNDGVQHEDP